MTGSATGTPTTVAGAVPEIKPERPFAAAAARAKTSGAATGAFQMLPAKRDCESIFAGAAPAPGAGRRGEDGR